MTHRENEGDTTPRFKHGDAREDGYHFWGYHPRCKDGEWWVTPEKWTELKNKALARRRLSQAPRPPKRKTVPTPKRGDLREDGFRFHGCHKKNDREIWLSPEAWDRTLGKPKLPQDKHSKSIRMTLHNTKRRAKANGWKFDLDFEYLAEIFPKSGRCPLSGEPMVWGSEDGWGNSPSVDRVDITKGYTKDNVWWISHRENRKKASFERILPPWVKVFSDGKTVVTDWRIDRPAAYQKSSSARCASFPQRPAAPAM
jgi:hypothetical protein